MKKIVVYSSLTGNTKKIGEAIASKIGCNAFSFEDERVADLSEYDFIAVGYYIDKGGPDAHFKRYIKEKVKNKKVGLFITLGAEPDGEHGAEMLEGGVKILEQNGNEVLRKFICQGAIDPKMIQEMIDMAERLGDKTMHPITEERKARWAAASTHPDENDIENAKKAFEGI
ncbi:flavodoxin family protein [Campylobacter pinnipediorum]|uniref:flavodoxin family protein n=1 Tax=Campylobacter pinnipediorum TaxID=1965231 RepID=UPI00084DCF6A|nr:flavodoxin family protein [Campylobacter pinnipediorum]OPA74504.1 flavodoxin [Campylobacter pinnipediorum subsp. pinnipediorum]